MKSEKKILKNTKLNNEILLDFDMRYSMNTLDVDTSNLSCMMEDNAINTLKGSYSSKVKVYVPFQQQGCRDFLLFVNGVTNGINIDLNGYNVYYDENFDPSEFEYTGGDSIYSFTEIESGSFLISKKNVTSSSLNSIS